MALHTYAKKRNFRVTREPKPSGRTARGKEPIFVVQLHHARARHYDFRLQIGNALHSWAVPKGPSFDPAVKRLAVEVEDHPLAYADFEGDIPKGEYGAGHVDIFDRGTWSTDGDPNQQLKKGHLYFDLHGDRLRGAWHLVRSRRDAKQPQWMLFKAKDEFVNTTTADDFLADDTTGVQKERKPIASKAKAQAKNAKASLRVRGFGQSADWSSHALAIDGARRVKMAADPFEPELAHSVTSPPEGETWLHETKWDGYRILATLNARKPRLWSRNALDWTAKAPDIVNALQALSLRSAQLDGELIVGKADPRAFNELQATLAGESNTPLVYALFDLLYIDGISLADCALVDRKDLLQKVLAASPSKHLLFSEHHIGDGDVVFNAAGKRGLEGIISKRVSSKYIAGRGRDWLKVKTKLSDEFAVVGYTKGRGSRQGFGALLLARPDKRGGWQYAGRMGSGFSDALLRTLAKKLPPLHCKNPPVDPDTLIDRDTGKPQWIKPRFVVEVYYRGFGKEGLLRQPSLKALREDKSANDLQHDADVPAKAASPSTRSSSKSRSKSSTRRAAPRNGSENPKFDYLTHPERVVFPGDGFTKLQVAQYYEQIMPWLLPQIADRPLSIVRCPDGATSACFFQKHHTPQIGKHVHPIALRDSQGGKINFINVDDAAGVRELVQMNVLEFHPWGSHSDQPDAADLLIFDLDPGPGVTWDRIADAAELLKGLLADLNLQSFVKLSGGKGLHVALPLDPPQPWDTAKSFCRQIAASLAGHQPAQFVDVANKAKRKGKIFVDYLRNTRGATSVAAYSLRARRGAPVAMPIEWRDIHTVQHGGVFTLRNTAQHLAKRRHDPWESMAALQQSFDRSLLRLLTKAAPTIVSTKRKRTR